MPGLILERWFPRAIIPPPLPITFPIDFDERKQVVLGRSNSSDVHIHLDDGCNTVSRRHAILTTTGGEYFIQNLGLNGCVLNNVQVPADRPTPIRHGDGLSICDFRFRFVDDRCECGQSPFVPQAFCPNWRTEHATGIAAKMHDEGTYAALPILADALEEAGCDNEDILTHCRELTVHVAGCWVIDLVLGTA